MPVTSDSRLLAPGRYRMTWGGYTQAVKVILRYRASGGWDAYFITALGVHHAVDTVPDAILTPIPPQ